MSEEVGYLATFGPKLNGIAQRRHSLPMATNEAATKIDMLTTMFLGMQVGELTNVIADSIQQRPGDVLRGEGDMARQAAAIHAAMVFGLALGLPLRTINLAHGAGNGRALEPNFVVVGAVDVAD